MLSSNGNLCTCVLQSKNYKPKLLKVDSSLWPTCWSYPWVDDCKEIIRNKEMLRVNQLLPSMYHLFFFFLTWHCRNLQMQIKKKFRVSEITIFTHSLFCLRHISRVCSDSCPLIQWCYLAISSSSTTFPFSLQSFPASESFSNKSALHNRWPKNWSFSFSISPSNECSGLISFRIDLFDLLEIQGTLKSLLQHHSLKASVLWCSTFFMVQLSHQYITTGKTIALTI